MATGSMFRVVFTVCLFISPDLDVCDPSLKSRLVHLCIQLRAVGLVSQHA